MKKPLSMKSEREELISLLSAMSACKKRIREIEDGESLIAECYVKSIERIYDDLSKAMSDLGDMVGYTVSHDIDEGLEMKL